MSKFLDIFMEFFYLEIKFIPFFSGFQVYTGLLAIEIESRLLVLPICGKGWMSFVNRKSIIPISSRVDLENIYDAVEFLTNDRDRA